MPALAQIVKAAAGLILTGARRDLIEQTLTTLYEADQATRDQALAEAEKLIVRAADRLPNVSRGIAEARTLEIYRQAREGKDWPLALSALKELNRLQRLHELPPPEPEQETPADRELAAIRAHLGPLHPAGDTVPAPELARWAAQQLTHAQAARHA